MKKISTAHEGFARHDIPDIFFVSSGENISEGLTIYMSQAQCIRYLSRHVSIEPEQWIAQKVSRSIYELLLAPTMYM